MDELLPYKSLIKYKYWAEAFYLLSHLYYITPAFAKVTKKLCWEILMSKSKGNAAYNILESIRALILNSKWEFIWINPAPYIESLESINNPSEELNNFAKNIHWIFWWDYRQILSYSKSRKRFVDSYAKKLWYETDEYLKQVKTLIQSDSFWSKVITWEMFLRKFDVLSDKFLPTKNVRDFSELSSIF